MKKEECLKIAKDFYELKFPDAECGFVAGSIMRGEGKEHSDIDLVVLYNDDFDDVSFQTHMFKNVVIEVFLHNLSAQNYYINIDAAKTGFCTIPSMVSEGVIIGTNIDLGAEQKKNAKKIVENGPAKLSEDEDIFMRFKITDLYEDLKDERPTGEKMGIVSSLYPVLANYILRKNAQWVGHGKAIIKCLEKYDTTMARQYVEVFHLAGSENMTPLINFIEDVLSSYGGPVRGGLYRKAPPAWLSNNKASEKS